MVLDYLRNNANFFKIENKTISDLFKFELNHWGLGKISGML